MNCYYHVLTFCKKWPEQFTSESDYEKAIRIYNGGRPSCDEFADFHYDLGRAHENYATQWGQSKEMTRTCEKLALEEFQIACELDPKNEEYDRQCRKKRKERSTQWAAKYGIDEKISKFLLPPSIEVEIAGQSIGDLGFSGDALPTGLKDEIAEVRKRLKYEMRFTLPVINFRDDWTFENRQYRFRICGIPLPMEKLDPKLNQAEQYGALARQIENVARKTAAQFYSSQDVVSSLRNVTTERPAAVEIEKSPEMLSGLTWVLKSLLNRQMSITDFDPIVSEFLLCRWNNLNLARTLEILASPIVRNRPNGNSLDSDQRS